MKKDRGSRFLPSPISPPNLMTDMPGASKISVLVVDDDPSILVITRLSLERDGEFQVRVARFSP